MLKTDPKCPWCGENHPTEYIKLWGEMVTTCPKLGANGVVFSAGVVLSALQPIPELGTFDGAAYAFKPVATPDPIAAARTPDGSLVVAHHPAGIEMRAFGAEDLDERGMPRWKP
jgi:hypothetical protein